MAGIASGTLHRRGLEPQMEVVALGHAEDALFYNPTPEIDSIFEILPRVASDAGGRQLAQLLVSAKKLNNQQTVHARTVCGFLDGLAVDLRDGELNDRLRASLSAKSIARALRPHLRTLADAEGVDAGALEALRSINRVAADTARAQLLSPAVEHELGRGPFSLLTEVLA